MARPAVNTVSGGWRRYEHLSWEYPSWASINGPAVNLLKGAVLCSDRVVTVSEARHAMAISLETCIIQTLFNSRMHHASHKVCGSRTCLCAGPASACMGSGVHVVAGCVCQDGSGTASDGYPHGLLIVRHPLVRQAAHVQLAHARHRHANMKAHRAPRIAMPQGYAWEICTGEGGWGLHNILQGRQHVTNGITNGIDMDEWDPARDAHTPAPFSAADTSGKAACKAALQAELGFDVDARVRPQGQGSG